MSEAGYKRAHKLKAGRGGEHRSLVRLDWVLGRGKQVEYSLFLCSFLTLSQCLINLGCRQASFAYLAEVVWRVTACYRFLVQASVTAAERVSAPKCTSGQDSHGLSKSIWELKFQLFLCWCCSYCHRERTWGTEGSDLSSCCYSLVQEQVKWSSFTLCHCWRLPGVRSSDSQFKWNLSASK